MIASFFVPGLPVPKGSGHAITSKTTKKSIWIPDSRKELRNWTRSIALIAKSHLQPVDGAVGLDLTFLLRRGKTVTRRLPTVQPDADKLERAVLDALTGIAYLDDCQVTDVEKRKRYAEDGAVGLYIEVREVNVP